MINPALIKVCIATDVKAVNASKHLLYKEYIGTEKWNFSANNPSGIRVASFENRKLLLVDNRDDLATWFVAYYENEVIGCGRACQRDSKNLFEIQAYNTGINFAGILSKDKFPNLVELTRGVVHPAFKNSGASFLILKKVLTYCQENQLSVFTAPSKQDVINFYRKIGFPHPGDIHFKWEPQDPKKALFFLADYQEGHIQIMLNNLEKIIKRLHECHHLRGFRQTNYLMANSDKFK